MNFRSWCVILLKFAAYRIVCFFSTKRIPDFQVNYWYKLRFLPCHARNCLTKHGSCWSWLKYLHFEWSFVPIRYIRPRICFQTWIVNWHLLKRVLVQKTIILWFNIGYTNLLKLEYILQIIDQWYPSNIWHWIKSVTDSKFGSNSPPFTIYTSPFVGYCWKTNAYICLCVNLP